MKKISIIGAGLSGLYAACSLAKKGHKVTVFEKNSMEGGRCRYFEADGFKFDMGPSWYWMPDVIDALFEELGENREDYFKIQQLDPGYQVYWKDELPTQIPTSREGLIELFESLEEGGGKKFIAFLDEAETKYKIAVAKFLDNPGIKWGEIINFDVLRHAFKLDLFKSVAKNVSKKFKSDRARAILNFPALFLGEMPDKIPSLYTLMNYADLELGTWYPEGGMHALPSALRKVAEKFGAEFHFDTPVESFSISSKNITTIHTSKGDFEVDEVIGGADYNFIEQKLVPKEHRKYDSKYWDKRKMAPSCLIFYLGVDKKVEGLHHHNLFFDEDLFAHGKEIYENPKWPTKPLFYVCAPSKTDKDVAPEGKENLFILMPIAPDIEDSEETREKYYKIIMERMESHLDLKIQGDIIFKKSYCVSDFKKDYNSYKGNAYGLANTLLQTANLKPKIKSKLTNLTYCGQLTVPGPGMPAVMMSGKVAANLISQKL
ncbi:MAG: phytoene desaturase family protein [Crocinitomicaceae bacterium]|nr:phytoene desaturase family protein [Crocinitomicaceae bacterium]